MEIKNNITQIDTSNLDIKLGLDFGNSSLCVAGSLNNTIITKNISSTFTNVTNYSSKNVVSCDDISIQLGEKIGSEFTSLDKTKRVYLKHQILWAVNSIYGPSEQTYKLSIGLGLPIGDYGDTPKRNAFEKLILGFGTFEGTVDGRVIRISIKRVDINAEGIGSIRALLDHIPDNGYTTLIQDIGFVTTDVIQVDVKGDSISVKKPITINKGISFIYETLYNELIELEAITSMMELDYYVRNDYKELRTKNNELYPLREKLMNRAEDCATIINDISNLVGVKTTTFNKIFIGGGSVLLFEIIGDSWVKNHIKLDDNTRYNSNAIGYYLNL